MADYEIHTGGCVLPGNRGGWAYIKAQPKRPGDYRIASGHRYCDNPHSMELQAVAHALQRTKPGDRVTVITDSDYVYDYARFLVAVDFRDKAVWNSVGRDKGSWMFVRMMASRRNVIWRKISSGSTDLNRVCDQKARTAAQKRPSWWLWWLSFSWETKTSDKKVRR